MSQGDKTHTIVVAKAFNLNLNGDIMHFPVGTHRVTQQVAEHKYTLPHLQVTEQMIEEVKEEEEVKTPVVPKQPPHPPEAKVQEPVEPAEANPPPGAEVQTPVPKHSDKPVFAEMTKKEIKQWGDDQGFDLDQGLDKNKADLIQAAEELYDHLNSKDNQFSEEGEKGTE